MNEPPPPSPPPEHLPHADGRADYPVSLDVAGWRCLVVGGGAVAARRAAGLLAAGARVTVVAPTVVASLSALAGGAERTTGSGPALVVQLRPYRPGEAGGYQFVVTATGRPGLDDAVVRDARGAGTLVASAGRRAAGTVRLPAVHRSGPVTLAVSTAGISPALARWLRTRLAACLPAETDTIAVLVDEARTAQQRAGRPTSDVEWAALLDLVVPLVESGRVAEARAILRSAGGPPDPG
jgi:siroheme synthase-like protein